MIAIINISNPATSRGLNQYEIRINEKVITHFDHKREDGLSKCLLRASEAVERAVVMDYMKVLDIKSVTNVTPEATIQNNMGNGRNQNNQAWQPPE